jgi:alpha-1,3-glucosyltransferase
VADAAVYIPALLIALNAIPQSDHLALIVALLFPGQIIIDNGHFQYNNISLGLAALAVAALLYDRIYLGSLMFVLALNYKQMELYHALPFFFYLLHKCFEKKQSR